MIFFIDTEFNSFKGELISMALVGEDGCEFYGVLNCANPDPWVAQHVMPVLGKPPMMKVDMQRQLEYFLSAYASIHIIADWPEDIMHFCDFLITGPGQRINTPALSMEIRRDLDAVSAVPHNALEDAKAIRKLYLEMTS